MSHDKIFIREVPGTQISQAVRINSGNDIPSFLKEYVSVNESSVCVYFGPENRKNATVSLGAVIIYDYLEPCLNDFSIFETLPEGIFEKEGVFYKESPILQAAKIEKELPDFMDRAKIYHYEDSYALIIRGGVALITPETKGYFAFHGYTSDNGGISIVDTIYEYEYSKYIICDEKGNYLSPLL